MSLGTRGVLDCVLGPVLRGMLWNASPLRQEIGRRPARNLEIEDLTGLIPWPADLVPQQLPLPLSFVEGVSC